MGSEVDLSYEQLGNALQCAAGDMHVVLRTSLPPESIAATVRREVGALDASLPIVDLR